MAARNEIAGPLLPASVLTLAWLGLVWTGSEVRIGSLDSVRGSSSVPCHVFFCCGNFFNPD